MSGDVEHCASRDSEFISDDEQVEAETMEDREIEE